jgi:S1-C subfamily serine protease
MTGVDWLIVAFTALLALYGYGQGFILGLLSLVGFLAGAFIGTRLAPLILPGGSRSQYAPLFGLLGALLAGGALASGLEAVGVRVRSALPIRGLRRVDGLLGAALTACVGLGIAWIVGAVAVQSVGSRPLRADIQKSAILRGLNGLLPPSGPILHALGRFDQLPSVHGPAADVAAPSRGILASRSVRAAGVSVVRIIGSACGLGIEGSGWVAGAGLVVTNAHVVAGERDTRVQIGGSLFGLPARALVFDPHDDIAVLSVAGLRTPALDLAGDPRSGTAAAILGYPLDGGFDREAGRIGVTQAVSTDDAYGNGPVLRSVTSLRGRVRPGNSGGPVVDASGRVVATVFAALTGTSKAGGFAVPNAVVRRGLRLARSRRASLSTRQCVG